MMSELILPAVFMGLLWIATFRPADEDITFEEIDNEIKNK
jgi:hypothetical protein